MSAGKKPKPRAPADEVEAAAAPAVAPAASEPFAVGTVSIQEEAISGYKKLLFRCVLDSAGNLDVTTDKAYQGELVHLTIVGTQPPPLPAAHHARADIEPKEVFCDITLADEDGVDVLMGQGMKSGLSGVVQKSYLDKLGVVANDRLTLTIQGGPPQAPVVLIVYLQ